MTVFPLNAVEIVFLSFVQLVTAVSKSFIGTFGFYLFFLMEVICCTTIAVSLTVQVVQLSYWMSKLLFGLVISLHCAALLVDICFESRCLLRAQNQLHNDSSIRRWYNPIKIDVNDFFMGITPDSSLLIIFPILLIVYTLLWRAVEIFNTGTTGVGGDRCRQTGRVRCNSWFIHHCTQYCTCRTTRLHWNY